MKYKVDIKDIAKQAGAAVKRALVWFNGQSEQARVKYLVLVSAGVCFLMLTIPLKDSGDGHENSNAHESGGEHSEHDQAMSIALSDDVLKSSSMGLEEAKANEIKPYISTRGEIIENSNRSMNVKPRFSGIVKSVHKDFGDQVKRGDTLLVIESAATRSLYTIKSAVDGVVADKNVVAGQYVPEKESVFRIVNLDAVWFQARVPIDSARLIQVGFAAEIVDRLFHASGTGNVLYVSPIVDEDTQASDLRVELPNPAGLWKVGSFAEAKVLLKPVNAKVAVKVAAIQRLNDQWVVFKKSRDGLVATPVVMGAMDDFYAEILSGVGSGETYLSSNSYLAKSELLKMADDHEH